MTSERQLPSRLLTKAASELGDCRRRIQNRGITLDGYKFYFRNTSVIPPTTTDEYAERHFDADQAQLAVLLEVYNNLQAERRRSLCVVHADDGNALDMAHICTCSDEADKVRTDHLQAMIEVHREWYGSPEGQKYKVKFAGDDEPYYIDQP